MRLSQVFVLPAFQKRGVGRALLAAATVHAQAAGALDMTVRLVSWWPWHARPAGTGL